MDILYILFWKNSTDEKGHEDLLIGLVIHSYVYN